MANIRNSQLLQRVQAHPLKATLAKALDIAEAFAGDCQFLQLDKNLSQEGRDNARRTKLRGAIRDLRDARAPIDEMQKKLDAKRAAVAMPAFDPKDVVGFLRRQELRAALRMMDRGPRAQILQLPEFADAMLEQPPILSGLVPEEQFLVDSIKENAASTPTLTTGSISQFTRPECPTKLALAYRGFCRLDLKDITVGSNSLTQRNSSTFRPYRNTGQSINAPQLASLQPWLGRLICLRIYVGLK
jgi:hypothetical protein